MTAARANFTGGAEGLESHEITWEEYLTIASGSLADATIEPLPYEQRPAEPVTHTEGLNNGR